MTIRDEENDVTTIAREITKVTQREGWKADQSIVSRMQRLLSNLTTLKVDKELLQRTKIGAAVNKLKKHHDEIVRGYSSSLTKKWKNEVGIAVSTTQLCERQSVGKNGAGKCRDNQMNLENARKRLQEGYASEKAKRDSRTVQILTGPIAKGKRGKIVSTAPSRSSIGRAQLMQRRTHLSANQRASSVPSGGRRVFSSSSSTQLQTRRPAASLVNLSAEERHRQRQLKYRALSGQGGCESDYRESERTRSSCSSSQANGRLKHVSQPSSASSSRSSLASKDLSTIVDARKAMLDKMYPRVCGVGNISSSNTSASGANKKSRPSTVSKRKETNYTEGQREVLSWLKGLSVDMSEYAPAFFENGFDSVKLLSTIKKSDLPSLVPKKGHHRLIQQALDELWDKHSTSAASQRRDRFQKESRVRRNDPFEDDDSDDSFVVSDDGEYRPGHIAAMFRKNRKRRYSIDSEDSINMEASFDEIQKEEKRSALYGEYEDFREDMRNKKMLKKK